LFLKEQREKHELIRSIERKRNLAKEAEAERIRKAALEGGPAAAAGRLCFFVGIVFCLL
jgi:hypothetical protein